MEKISLPRFDDLVVWQDVKEVELALKKRDEFLERVGLFDDVSFYDIEQVRKTIFSEKKDMRDLCFSSYESCI